MPKCSAFVCETFYSELIYKREFGDLSVTHISPNSPYRSTLIRSVLIWMRVARLRNTCSCDNTRPHAANSTEIFWKATSQHLRQVILQESGRSNSAETESDQKVLSLTSPSSTSPIRWTNLQIVLIN